MAKYLDGTGLGQVWQKAKDTFLTPNGGDTRYLKLSGGSVTGKISGESGGAWIAGRDNVVVEQTRTSGNGHDWHPVIGVKTSAGYWSLGSVGGETLMFSYDTDTNYNTGSNSSSVINLPTAGTEGTLALTSQIPTAMSNSEIDTIMSD